MPDDAELVRDSLSVEVGGCWKLQTRSSSYVVDLDHRTVQRFSGEHRLPLEMDDRRPLMEIRNCRVGESAHFRAAADSFLDEYVWSVSSEVLPIIRITGGSSRQTP